MKVEQCIIDQSERGTHRITGRVHLACEPIGSFDDSFAHVRLLEAGAGLDIGAELTVPLDKISE